jgi:hypothetical protein
MEQLGTTLEQLGYDNNYSIKDEDKCSGITEYSLRRIV